MGNRRREAVQLVIFVAWVLAVAALVAVVLGCGFMLVHRFLRLLNAVGELFAAPAVLDGVHRVDTGPRPLPSVLEPRAEARDRRDRIRLQSAERRARRSLARLDRARHLIAPWREG